MDNIKISKDGISNLRQVGNKFVNYMEDEDSQNWLSTMDYDLDKIENIEYETFYGEKPDLVLNIKYNGENFKENILVKLINSLDSNNQLEKIYLDGLYEKWDLPDDIYELLQWFTGEVSPYKEGKDLKRMYLTEFSESDQRKLINWFNENKETVAEDIFEGFANEELNWMLVVERSDENSHWELLSIDQAKKYYIVDDEISITPWGSLDIGKVTMLRKGGDDDTSNMLIFRFRPGSILKEEIDE